MTATSNTAGLANKVIKKIMAGLTKDWLTKEVDRYLGDLSLNFYLLSDESSPRASVASSELAPIETRPLLSFATYLESVDGAQIFPILSFELPDGSVMESKKILEDLVGPGETVYVKMKEEKNFLAWLEQHFPAEYHHQLTLAESVAKNSQVEARIRAAYAEAVEMATTGSEGLRNAAKQLGDFMTNFPKETCRTYFNDAIRDELTEAQVREMVHARELYRAIAHTQPTHL